MVILTTHIQPAGSRYESGRNVLLGKAPQHSQVCNVFALNRWTRVKAPPKAIFSLIPDLCNTLLPLHKQPWKIQLTTLFQFDGKWTNMVNTINFPTWCTWCLEWQDARLEDLWCWGDPWTPGLHWSRLEEWRSIGHHQHVEFLISGEWSKVLSGIKFLWAGHFQIYQEMQTNIPLLEEIKSLPEKGTVKKGSSAVA